MRKFLVPPMRIHTDFGCPTIADLSVAPYTVNVYDGWGTPSPVFVRKRADKMPLSFITLASGMMFPLGRDSDVRIFKAGDAQSKVVKVSALEGREHVLLPTRKTALTFGQMKEGDIFLDLNEGERVARIFARYGIFDEDNERPTEYRSMVYLDAEDIPTFNDMAQLAALYGCAVTPRFKDHRLEIDPMRPSCFATKVFAGRGVEDVADLVNDLVDSMIVTPVLPFEDMVLTATRSGILAEGEVFDNTQMITSVLHTDNESAVYEIESDSRTMDVTWARM